MPVAKRADPGSLRSRIKLWLLDNPGAHPAAAIVAGIGADDEGQPIGDRKGTGQYKPVTSELGRMVRRGELTRFRPPGSPRMGPGAVYSLPPR